MPPQPCFDFQRGRCRRGSDCRFSHHTAITAASSSKITNAKSHEESETEAICRKWTNMIPRPNRNSLSSRASVNLTEFFQMGWDLIESEDEGTRQHVITKLGAETGLVVIKMLADIMGASQKDETTISIFQNRTLPFYRIISHPDVLSSLILETPVYTIYNFLFGINGQRSLSVFRFTATALSKLSLRNSSYDEETSISSSLAVLDRLIEINQSAQVVEGFTNIVKRISACIPEDFMAPKAQQSLTRIRRRLNIGSSLHIVQPQSSPQILLSATFDLPQDLPGNLSNEGARHDNDHASVAEIQILPTAQEIASSRQEYLPMIDSTQQHLSGLAALLDRQFRLLREDTVGQLRDAVREEAMRLEHPNRNMPRDQGQQNVRRLIYHNVRFSRLCIDRRRGLQAVAEFDQPPQIHNKSIKQREDWWKVSKLLRVDSLVCFVSSNGKIIFLSVCDPASSFHGKEDPVSNDKSRSEDIPSLFRQANRASVLLGLAEYKPEDAIWISTHVAPSKVRQSLVEFPGVLLPSFQPTLQALQRMSQTLDLPFAEIIAPDSQTSAPVFNPPAYATTRGFGFNLDVLTGVPLILEPGKPFDITKLEECSTLDEAQQVAVIQSLSTGLALIQGPPGTGKSYTGEAIIKILLRNRKAAKLGPIICVCYTNHALDQLLEHLVKGGVKQVIRLGSQSKSEVLQKVTLREVAQNIDPTRTEKHDRWEHNRNIGITLKEIETILVDLNNPTSWTNIQAHLMKTHDTHFKELFGKGVDEDGFQEVKGRKFRVLDSWIRGAPKRLTSNRPVHQLLDLSLKKMSTSERRSLHNHWIRERTTQLADDLINALEEYHGSKSALDKCQSELDLRCLREANVIGVTTSGLARNIDLLQRVRAKVMLCEEAGEVLEAHTLTAFLPGVEHAILIGDHEQLRPQINNYELQHDNLQGKRYSLDISLFERLVRPQSGSLRVPLNTLKIQRRMFPSISKLITVPLYPDLRDHPSVSEYPEVDGMRHRLYWFDHQEKEDSRVAQAISLSRTNTFEVEITASLVSHLVRQGTYRSEDIAIITPYLGQLQKIKKRLANSFEIVVGDRDQEDLETKGLQDIPETSSDSSVRVQKTTLLNALRIATVDNFQGEEAKVIVVSLVRSNDERKCGFLKTSNRINVLLSRARHGMYIIGNSNTARPVPMWAKVISIMERSNNIGPSLALCCPRHKDVPIEVAVPDDFARLSPEGGCSKRCSSRLLCGHSCPNMCHSTSLHNAVHCLEHCLRTKRGCEHKCPKHCGDPCDAECQVLIFNVLLPCGHNAEKLKCHEVQKPQEVHCQAPMGHIMKNCNHNIQVHCHELPLEIDHPCSAICGAALTCGHNCTHICKYCNIRKDGLIVQKIHGVCKTPCGRPFTTCSHSCTAPCHGDISCPPCTQPCEVSCYHSRCSKLCHEPCAPCAEDCSWSCPHRGRCPLPCAVPCDLLPCSERCTKILTCGHQCPSICGEVCRGEAYCQICAHKDIKEMIVDFILSSTFEEVDLDDSPCIIPPCGHVLTLESMDGHMSMSDFYTMDAKGTILGLNNSNEPFSASGIKSCPICRGPLRNLNRYGRIVRRALIDESTKKFIVWANMVFLPLVTRMQDIEEELRKFDGCSQSISNGVSLEAPLKPLHLKGTRDHQIFQIEALVQNEDQYKTVIKLRRDIKKFLQQVDEREQPFGRIYDLAQDARRHRGINIDLESKVDILQVRNRLLTTVLLIRCDYTILLTFLDGRKGGTGATFARVQVDLSTNRKDCEELIAESESRVQPANSVEGHLYWARFLVLERSFAEPSSELKELLGEAKRHLRQARKICDEFPGQTKGMREEVEDIEKMLRDSTFYLPVSNEEKAAVYAAMAQNFRGTGHWYYCENGHPFTIGECGMPMETSQCPQCGSPVGGRNHNAVDGVRRATDLEHQFGGLEI